jgi:hypothetical protein
MMGKLIELSDYRKKVQTSHRDGIFMEVVPPMLIFRHMRGGAVVKEERVVSESMLRELLDWMI